MHVWALGLSCETPAPIPGLGKESKVVKKIGAVSVAFVELG